MRSQRVNTILPTHRPPPLLQSTSMPLRPRPPGLRQSSIDDELAEAASSLSVRPTTVGPTTVYHCNDFSFALPKKLHSGLYSSSAGDMMPSTSVNIPRPGRLSFGDGRNAIGVPGFPDFPDVWFGEVGGQSRKSKKKPNRKHDRHKASGHSKRQQRRIQRKAVNMTYGGVASQERKLRLKEQIRRRYKDAKEQRQDRRKAAVKNLQTKRQRKREMASICSGISSLKCA